MAPFAPCPPPGAQSPRSMQAPLHAVHGSPGTMVPRSMGASFHASLRPDTALYARASSAQGVPGMTRAYLRAVHDQPLPMGVGVPGFGVLPSDPGQGVRPTSHYITPDDYQGPPIPHDFLCPITHEIMADPVRASDGHNYEFSALSRWALHNDTSPLTRQPLDPRVFRDTALRQSIGQWVRSHSIGIVADTPHRGHGTGRGGVHPSPEVIDDSFVIGRHTYTDYAHYVDA